MSRRKPARVGITDFLSRLQRQVKNFTSSSKNWLEMELRRTRARPIWLRILLVTWRVITLLLTMSQRALKQQWRKRGELWLSTQRRFSRSGFLLPMVSVLLVVFSLVVAAVLLQSVNRTTEVGAKRNEQIVYNSGTLAIDRSKSKIEYLFNGDPRWPRGLPSDDVIEYMLLNGDPNPDPNDPETIAPHDLDDSTAEIDDPYTLGDETRLDIDGDGRPDNAWTFEVEGDTGVERVAYALLTRVRGAGANSNVTVNSSDDSKARNLVIRNGPINMTEPNDTSCIESINSDEGWETITNATVRRAFHTYVVVVKDQGTQRSVSTLEMQQDREVDKGNKWGAWFRNDLEIFPGPDFRWNGAVHTEGNLIIGDSNTFSSYLISSSDSCLYARQNSEITIGGNSDETTPPFLGQLIRGSLKTNSYAGSFRMDTHGASGPQDTFVVNDGGGGSNHIDSVRNGSPLPANLSLDPVALWTTNDNISRSAASPPDENNSNIRDTAWKDRPLVQEGRVFNSSSQPPYVDDTYRADNRYGPKPRYTQLIGLNQKIGTGIISGDLNSLTLLYENESRPDNSGLDGYWERRARGEGLSITVGQRLELGNTNGWGGVNDPLYPPQQGVCTGTRCHEQRQWRTMRDNLAAVQSTVVYHNDRTGSENTPVPGRFPLACLASTAHPGTRTANDNNNLSGTGTITNANTFARTADNILITDFFTGNGTNGWEFNGPGNESDNFIFANRFESETPLRIALTNLAYFAGDPFGGFPARQDSNDGNNGNDVLPAAGPVVHPYPTMSMWGDFSDLRRAMERINGEGLDYRALSMSDQSTVQTAACTLGMLAYNVNNVTSYDYAANSAEIVQLAIALREPTTVTGSVPQYIQTRLDDTSLAYDPADIRPEDYIAALTATGTRRARRYDTSGNPTGPQNARTNAQLAAVARSIYWKEQLTRDRRFGFNDYISPNYVSGASVQNGWSDPTLPRLVRFNPEDNGYFGMTVSSTTAEDIRAIAQALTPGGVKFPALFYIFPRFDHNHNASTSTDTVNVVQPTSEPYIDDATDYVSRTNQGLTYRTVNPFDIILTPRERTAWQIPSSTSTTNRVNFIRDNTVTIAPAFLDKGMFNGREMMSVRTMDIDLDLLRNNSYANERWLPYSGIVYAFREDAVREDEIARPTAAGATFAGCDRAAEILSNNCRMNAVGATPQDPPVNDQNWVSSKPVDFYADPDRRPYGFRLRKGGDLRRVPAPPSQFNLRGLSFISDNPVYVFGDSQIGGDYVFNGHLNASSGGRIEEFTQLLSDTWGNFYSRSTINENFAREGDSWRPAEVIADAITIVSNNFVDGSMAEGIRRADVGNLSSYRTLNAPSGTGTISWLREDGSVSSAANYPIPIRISRNGVPQVCTTPGGAYVADNTNFNGCIRGRNQIREYNGSYIPFTDGKPRIGAQTNTRVNFSVVSGIVPSRAGNSYGGLHNFPRFIEDWSNRNLYISGALVQLNFSTSATAPFDHDSWEPTGANANPGSEPINYYGAPNRRWGYDVGLQYSPAGPVAARFNSPSGTRSEFYREPPVDDPYMCILRESSIPGGGSAEIDPDLSNC
ncbi:hormogonium polysaccharide biosynthesis protein HpsA [Gloeocapsa sp. PCC 73106]|uniref:hormogonium polysaccharide biosynthesis protein HpsA n=1 Tax=Gloeocapsa sp. PCC 73106 TaxID=102232 RepID=UPI0002ACA499|nr:hormogonium polysaccharide biosynthesis protein HpsA [Gloeocapsa sp. PCC 73106]ELR97278.1 hypothetical protein GLO73106DRAFT_00010860 [Gloeocapsa sp. PCC 73106]